MTSWEGLDLVPAHRRWRFWVAEGRDELPEARASSELVPFRRGRLHKPGIANRRVLELRGYIQESTLAAFRAQHDTLKGLLDPERSTTGTLVDDFEGSERWIRAIPRNLIARYGGEATRLLSIELEALDPYWYGVHGDSLLDDGLLLDDGELLDQGGEIVVTPTLTSEPVLLTPGGTADVERVRVELTGPSVAGAGLEVAVGIDVVGFVMTVPLASGETLVVDNFERTVRLDGNLRRDLITLRPANRNGEYLRIPPGSAEARVLGQPASARILFSPTFQ